MKRIQLLLLGFLMAVSMLSGAQVYVLASENVELSKIDNFGYVKHEEEETVLAEDDDKKLHNGYELSKPRQNTQSRQKAVNDQQSCGDSLTWSLKDGILTISGSGKMNDYDTGGAPWYSDRLSITKIVMKGGITAIGEKAFYNLTNLTSVSIPNTVKSIHEAAFYGCSSITEISLPASVSVLEAGAFANCSDLENFSGNGITKLGEYVYQNTTLNSFQISKLLTDISPLAFFNCPLSSFTVTSGNTVFTVKDGVLFTDNGKTLFMYPAGKIDTTYKIPSTITKISDSAFNFNRNLTDITIPSSVKSIGSSAFQACYNLKSVKIPDSVTSVGKFTFYECMRLESVTFGKGLTSTSYQMFKGCSELENVDFGSMLKSLDAQTFANCSSLTNITLPVNITSIGNGCFAYDYDLVNFTAKGLKNIPYQAFFRCTKLKNVFLNEGVTDIYRSAFYGCKSIETVTMPKSTKFVHSLAFPSTTKISCMNPQVRAYGVNGYRYLQNVSINVLEDYNNAYKVLQLVNEQRKAKGLNELVMDSSLLNSAMIRAGENALLFSHTRPDSSSAFDLNDQMIAENVAAGQTTPQEVMESWMNSKGHKENILSKDAKTIGIGVVKHNGVYYWVQCFGSDSNITNCPKPANKTTSQTIALANDTFSEAATGNDIIWSPKEYTFKFNTQLDKTSISKGATAKAKVYVTNPGFTSHQALLNNDKNITWSSSNTNVATVSSNGSIKGIVQGSANITARLQYFRPSAKLTVTCPHKYTSTVTKATTTKNGKITYKCSCGATKAATTIYHPKSVSLSATNFIYNGKIQKPTVKVVGSDGKTISSANYTISYSGGCKNVGRYTVSVNFKGNYSGTIKKTINILPKATGFTKVSSISKGIRVSWGKRTVETSGYQLQYSTNSNFSGTTTKTITISNTQTINKTITNLDPGKKYYVRIRAYKTSKYKGEPIKLYSSWSKTGAVVTKK